MLQLRQVETGYRCMDVCSLIVLYHRCHEDDTWSPKHDRLTWFQQDLTVYMMRHEIDHWTAAQSALQDYDLFATSWVAPYYLDVDVVLAVLDGMDVGVEDGVLTSSSRPAVSRAQHLKNCFKSLTIYHFTTFQNSFNTLISATVSLNVFFTVNPCKIAYESLIKQQWKWNGEKHPCPLVICRFSVKHRITRLIKLSANQYNSSYLPKTSSY